MRTIHASEDLSQMKRMDPQTRKCILCTTCIRPCTSGTHSNMMDISFDSHNDIVTYINIRTPCSAIYVHLYVHICTNI
jgi:ferredoxin